MRKVEQIMGMPIVIEVDYSDSKAVAKAFNIFKNIDTKFSPYKPNSEVSLFSKDKISEDEISEDLKFVVDECARYKKLTNGYFSANSNNKFDPSGYVKAWAIKRAGEFLQDVGVKDFCISAGGDIWATGPKKWTVGIQDPYDNSKLVKTIYLTSQAIATSGNYERGKHIYNPLTQQPVDYWKSVSVIGKDIIVADVLATACFAAGEEAPTIMAKFKDYEAILLK